jgi:membrane-bound serine protease (ClpP class)
MRARATAVILLLFGGLVALIVGGPNASASAQDGPGRIDVIQVSGWLDPVVVDFVNHAIDAAEDGGAEALIIQLDSPGALVDDDAFDDLLARVEGSEVPVVAWIGVGGQGLREAGELVEAAAFAGMATGTRVEIGDEVLTPSEALEAGVVHFDVEESAVLRNLVIALDGESYRGRTIDTADIGEVDGEPTVTESVVPRFSKLDLVPRVMHTVASAPVAYLLLTAGLGLVVFELFTAGAGVAAAVAIGALTLAAYGLWVLPTTWVGLALLVFGTFGFAVDVQTGVPRVWTGLGVAAYIAGSVVLFDDPVSLGWIPLVAGVVGMVLLMVAGLPATVRSRFSTPTIGRESMVGELGEVVSDLRPRGVVRVREALWPARVNRATPVAAGDQVVVVAIEGATLEVAPSALVDGDGAG